MKPEFELDGVTPPGRRTLAYEPEAASESGDAAGPEVPYEPQGLAYEPEPEIPWESALSFEPDAVSRGGDEAPGRSSTGRSS